MIRHKIVLASASPRRRELLAQVGILPEIIPSKVEELVDQTDPKKVVMGLSQQKAEDVAAGCEKGTIVIGADTVVSVRDKILGKPRDIEEAVRMVTMLQGDVHQVYTGVTLILCGENIRMISYVEKTDVWVYSMTAGEILQYAACGEPMDKAGAYGIQGRFAAYIQRIDGDYSNVVGLPLGRTCQELKKLEDFQEE